MRSRTQARRLAALEGLISTEVGEALYDLARGVPEDQNIVEIGAYKGKSTCYLGEGSRDGNRATIHSVDLWDTEGNVGGRHGFNDPAVHEAWRDQVASQKLVSLVNDHKTSGVEYAAAYRGKPVGLLYIDGDHSYESVKADFEAWAGHLAEGAVVAFDDYSDRNPGVRQFVDELRVQAGDNLIGWTFRPAPLAYARVNTKQALA